MPMREECKHFQSRTYGSGESARFCVLDLAPEAPWRCPSGCGRYERRLADAGWAHGRLVEPAVETEPLDAGEGIGSVLAEAEEIVSADAPEALAAAERAERAAERPRWLQRLRPGRRRG